MHLSAPGSTTVIIYWSVFLRPGYLPFRLYWTQLHDSLPDFPFHSFIHSDYFYSASSSPLLLRSAPDTARILCQSFTPKRHRQLWVNLSTSLAQGPSTWRLKRESNPRPSGWKLSTQPMRHQVPRPGGVTPISPSCINLHWLPISTRIEYKILLIVLKAQMGVAPKYLHDAIRLPTSASSLHPLRSLDRR